MTIDERGRRAAKVVQEQIAATALPEAGGIRRWARSRARRNRGVVAMALAAMVAIAAVTLTGGGRERPIVTTPEGPFAVSEEQWSWITKAEAGLGSYSQLLTSTTVDGALLLGGLREGGLAEIWRTTDGLLWSRTVHPEATTGAVRAVAVSGSTALAVGRGFVWRSADGGQTWIEAAAGLDIFGAPGTNDQPVVTGLVHNGGYWIASGGAANGYAGIWVSTDGATWREVLGDRTTGASFVTVVTQPDGSLAAYSLTTAWFTNDPTTWGPPVPLSVTDSRYLRLVSPDGMLGLGARASSGDDAYAILRRGADGSIWTVDDQLQRQIPDIRPYAIGMLDGLWVVAGTDLDRDHREALVSSDGVTWFAIPESVRGRGVGVLTSVATIDERVLFFDTTSPGFDRYYVLDLAGTR
ncbi:MAG TPA: hypothetical protein VGQ20_06590 [Acidimicrobiales bacterium]|nr:hypothetical protein [Acidimicrobiales bacterium]